MNFPNYEQSGLGPVTSFDPLPPIPPARSPPNCPANWDSMSKKDRDHWYRDKSKANKDPSQPSKRDLKKRARAQDFAKNEP